MFRKFHITVVNDKVEFKATSSWTFEFIVFFAMERFKYFERFVKVQSKRVATYHKKYKWRYAGNATNTKQSLLCQTDLYYENLPIQIYWKFYH